MDTSKYRSEIREKTVKDKIILEQDFFIPIINIPDCESPENLKNLNNLVKECNLLGNLSTYSQEMPELVMYEFSKTFTAFWAITGLFSIRLMHLRFKTNLDRFKWLKTSGMFVGYFFGLNGIGQYTGQNERKIIAKYVLNTENPEEIQKYLEFKQKIRETRI